jgi:WD40 repeat protein
LKKSSSKILVLVLFILIIFYSLDKNSERRIDKQIDQPQMSRHDYLWDYYVIDSDEDSFWDSAISSDGNYSVVGTGKYSNSYIGRVYLFHKSNSTPIWNYTINNDIRSVAISADGSYIVAGGGNSFVYLFHKSNSAPIWNFSAPSGGVRSVAISLDGNYIVAAAREFGTHRPII